MKQLILVAAFLTSSTAFAEMCTITGESYATNFMTKWVIGVQITCEGVEKENYEIEKGERTSKNEVEKRVSEYITQGYTLANCETPVPDDNIFSCFVWKQ